MKNAPEKIYLNTGYEEGEDVDFSELFEITWSKDKVFSGDLEYLSKEYVEQAFIRRLKKLKEKQDSQTSMQIKSEYNAIMHEILVLESVIGINLENI